MENQHSDDVATFTPAHEYLINETLIDLLLLDKSKFPPYPKIEDVAQAALFAIKPGQPGYIVKDRREFAGDIETYHIIREQINAAKHPCKDSDHKKDIEQVIANNYILARSAILWELTPSPAVMFSRYEKGEYKHFADEWECYFGILIKSASSREEALLFARAYFGRFVKLLLVKYHKFLADEGVLCVENSPSPVNSPSPEGSSPHGSPSANGSPAGGEP